MADQEKAMALLTKMAERGFKANQANQYRMLTEPGMVRVVGDDIIWSPIPLDEFYVSGEPRD